MLERAVNSDSLIAKLRFFRGSLRRSRISGTKFISDQQGPMPVECSPHQSFSNKPRLPTNSPPLFTFPKASDFTTRTPSMAELPWNRDAPSSLINGMFVKGFGLESGAPMMGLGSDEG
ncbi:hypothetical protein V6N11_082170 [Hibiscus sabdariffa]|uniref:Uncharacterized protein n=1 Tax=Hibiscus sabdariffa TaxID=183260 RepID=A0ABR2QHA0_9ROSI